MKDADYKRYMQLISENLLDEATDFRREIMPRYIYKFYSLTSKTGRGKTDKRTLDTLENSEIWCSKIEYFNDPYEGIGYYYELDREIEIRLADFLRIASFTEEAASNISMWAYYANNHRGFCVKYEVIDNSKLYDVNYIELRESQKKLWIEAMKKCALGIATDKEQLLIYEKYLTKHVSWSNEREYRIIWATERDDEKGRSVKCDEIGLKPVQIYTGINCSSASKKRIAHISRKLGCGEVVECAIDENKFVLLNE